MKLVNKLIGVTVIAVTFSAMTGCSNQKADTGKNEIPGSDTVLISSMQFLPAKIQAEMGDTITWINNDLVDHNVRDTIHNLFYSDTLKTNQSYRWIVTESASYICTIHPTMNGSILIPKENGQ